MQALYFGCIALSGLALVAITLMVPLGVFMRYVMGQPLSWPEPAAVVLMVMFSFLGGAAVYRAKGHVAVEAFLAAVPEKTETWLRRAVDGCMIATALFMLVYGVHLCQITRHQSLAEFPALSVGIVYLPIPAAGALTLLFIFEKLWLGDPPRTDVMYSDQPAELE